MVKETQGKHESEDPCIFCGNKSIEYIREKVKPLNENGKYSDTQTICYRCQNLYEMLKEKYYYLF